MDQVDLLLQRVKDRAAGLLPLPVYRRLYETAASCSGRTIVEVGTYRGAATIAMALGSKSSGVRRQVITADLLRPGIGLEGKTTAAKCERLTETFLPFGVANDVRFVHGSMAALVAETDPQEIGLVLLDGGGCLEVDLALLRGRLADDAVIVIDDIDGLPFVTRTLTTAQVNQKRVISKLLVDRFVAAGLLIEEGRVGFTGWYRKGPAELAADEIRLLALPAYHQLIRVELGAAEFGLSQMVARALAARWPRLRQLCRRFWPAA